MRYNTAHNTEFCAGRPFKLRLFAYQYVGSGRRQPQNLHTIRKTGLILLLGLFSCGEKKLNEKKSTIGALEINCYQISLITSIHDHVEITKDGKTEQILKTNTGDVDTIFLARDTLVIKTIRRPVIYEKKDKVFNYLIKIDSVSVAVIDTMHG